MNVIIEPKSWEKNWKKYLLELSNFCGFMNLPSPVNTKPKLFNDIQQKIASIYLNLADDPVKYTANELIDKQGH